MTGRDPAETPAGAGPVANEPGGPDAGRGLWPHLSGTIRDGRHVLPVRIYYEDTDFSGIVYHANYLRYMERARTEYLRLLGADQRSLFEPGAGAAAGFAFVVRAMKIEFLKPARMDDLVEVITEPIEVRGASVMLRQQVTRADEVLVDTQVRVAFTAGGRAQPIPKALRVIMERDRMASADVARIGGKAVTRC